MTVRASQVTRTLESLNNPNDEERLVEGDELVKKLDD
jgi:hypothetical protein